VRGLSVAEAGIVVTLATVAWSLGSWWQSRTIGRIGAPAMVTAGTGVVALGILGVAAGLTSAPIIVPYIGWGLAGLGMGVAFPTIPLAAMSQASGGAEAGQLSSILLTDTLGAGIGTGLGGACIAIADSSGSQLRVGIAGAFAIGFAAALALIAIARRLPAGTPTDSAT
jgi:MFS family permease